MISMQDMAKDNLGFPVLNSSDVQHWNRTACVGPANVKNGETNYHAFARSSSEEEMYLDIVPPSVVTMLNDKSNWSNRLSAASDIERILKQPSTAISNKNLKSVTDLISTSMSDPQLKVSQKGLQLMQQLIAIVGKRISPFVPTLTVKILVKMGSNKGDLRRSGMHLFKVLMEAVGPMKVVSEVANSGLRYKTSRVREEAINVIISALILYDNGGLQLLPIAKEVVICLTDGKPKVRQAAFEAIALLASKLVESEFSQVIGMISNLHKRNESMQEEGLCDLNIMDAYHARLERHSIPTLDDEGTVRYSVVVLSPGRTGVQETLVYTGADIDWIMAATVPALTHQPSVESSALVQGKGTQRPNSPSFRPYRSAGKRPWETDIKTEVIVHHTFMIDVR